MTTRKLSAAQERVLVNGLRHALRDVDLIVGHSSIRCCHAGNERTVEILVERGLLEPVTEPLIGYRFTDAGVKTAREVIGCEHTGRLLGECLRRAGDIALWGYVLDRSTV
jgi:hypothetical protein